jgi:hypothetical protein
MRPSAVSLWVRARRGFVALHDVVEGRGDGLDALPAAELGVGGAELEVEAHFTTGRLVPRRMPEKKSLPLSSLTMKAGKSSTSIDHTASMPSSG